MKTIVFSARVLRKEAFLPRYIVIRPQHLEGQTSAFSAEVTLNGIGPFRRNIRPWGTGSDVFFFNLTEPQCLKAKLSTGDECVVVPTPLQTFVR